MTWNIAVEAESYNLDNMVNISVLVVSKFPIAIN